MGVRRGETVHTWRAPALLLLFVHVCCVNAITGQLWLFTKECVGVPTVNIELNNGTCTNFSNSVSGLLSDAFEVSIYVQCPSFNSSSPWRGAGFFDSGCIQQNLWPGWEYNRTSAANSQECYGNTILTTLLGDVPASVKIDCSPAPTPAPTPAPIVLPLPPEQIVPSGSSSLIQWDCASDSDCCTRSTCMPVSGSPYRACFLNLPFAGLCPRCPAQQRYSNGTCTGNATAATDHTPALFVMQSGVYEAPWIRMCFPNNDVTLVDGWSILPFRWESGNMVTPTSVTLELRTSTNSSFSYVVASKVPNTGAFDWVLSEVADFRAQPSTPYFVRIYSDQHVGLWNDSTHFSISTQFPLSFHVDFPFAGERLVAPEHYGFFPGTLGSIFNLNFRGSRCRSLYVAEDFGLSEGRASLIRGVGVQLRQVTTHPLLNVRITGYVTRDTVIGDRYMLHPARELVYVPLLNLTSHSVGDWINFTFNQPVSVLFPNSLVLEFSHLNYENARPANPSLGSLWTHNGNVYHVATNAPRRVCTGSDDWHPDTTPYPFPIQVNDLPPVASIPVMIFNRSDSFIPPAVSSCGGPPQLQPMLLDRQWRVITQQDCQADQLPACREGGAAVYYSGYVVSFGGLGQIQGRPVHFNDVFVLDLRTNMWSEITRSDCFTSASPTCRYYHTATRIGDYMYVLGGRDADAVVASGDQLLWRLSLRRLGDLLNGTVSPGRVAEFLWEKIPNPQRVRGTFRHSATTDGAAFLYVMGGIGPHLASQQSGSKTNFVYTDQVFRFDTRSFKWEDLSVKQGCCVNPGLTCSLTSITLCIPNLEYPMSDIGCFSRLCTAGHTLVFYNSSLWMYAGGREQMAVQSPTNELLRLDLRSPTAWEVVREEQCDNEQLPACRMYHTAVVRGDVLYSFGGQTTRNGSVASNDLWAYNFKTSSWSALSPALCTEANALSVPCVSDHVMVLAQEPSIVLANSTTNTTTNITSFIYREITSSPTNDNNNNNNNTNTSDSPAINLPPLIVFSGKTTAPGRTQLLNGAWMMRSVPFLMPRVAEPYRGSDHIITLVGVNFGSSELAVEIGGRPCTNVTIAVSGTALTCVVPEGVGLNVPAVVKSFTKIPSAPAATDPDGLRPLLSTALSFDSSPVPAVSYPPPSVNSYTDVVGSQEHATSGGYHVDVLGINFGPAQQSPPPQLFVGGAACLQTTWLSNTRLRCQLPPGAGRAAVVVVAGGQSSHPHSSLVFEYVRPEIHSVQYTSAPTKGGSVVTITGAYFGPPTSSLPPSTSAFVGSRPCQTTTYISSNTVMCVLPPGIGRSQLVKVTINGLDSAANARAVVNYSEPVVLALSSPSAASTAGGSTLTVYGINFGFASLSLSPNDVAAVFVLVNGVRCTESSLFTDVDQTQFQAALATGSTGQMVTYNATDVQEMRCIVPAGAGVDPQITVSAGNQLSAPANGVSSSFQYQGPAISSMDPPVVYIGKSNVALNVRGQNLGEDPATVSVSVAGQPCQPVSFIIPHLLLTCKLPQFQERQLAPVQVTVRGQQSGAAELPIDVEPVPSSLQKPMQALSGLFTCVLGGLLGWLVLARSHTVIKASSWSFSMLIVLGAILCLVSVQFLHRFDGDMCVVTPWFLAIGFTLLYGSLTLKNWRLLKVFGTKLSVRGTSVNDWTLLSMLMGLVAVDIVLLAAYSAVADCGKRTVHNDRAVVVLALMAVWKVGLLVAGVVTAIRARVVSIKEFQERVQIGYSVYNAAFAVTVSLPVIIALSGETAGVYMLSAIVIIFVPVTTCAIMFVPKIINIYFPTEEKQEALTLASMRGSVRGSTTVVSSRRSYKPSVSSSNTDQLRAVHLRVPRSQSARGASASSVAAARRAAQLAEYERTVENSCAADDSDSGSEENGGGTTQRGTKENTGSSLALVVSGADGDVGPGPSATNTHTMHTSSSAASLPAPVHTDVSVSSLAISRTRGLTVDELLDNNTAV